MKSKKRKSFDCIEFKRKAQEEIYEEIKEMGFAPVTSYGTGNHRDCDDSTVPRYGAKKS